VILLQKRLPKYTIPFGTQLESRGGDLRESPGQRGFCCQSANASVRLFLDMSSLARLIPPSDANIRRPVLIIFRPPLGSCCSAHRAGRARSLLDMVALWRGRRGRFVRRPRR